MKITKDTVVSVNYHLHAQVPNQEKTHIESTDTANPFTFLFGSGNLIAGFEKNLANLQKGDTFDFTIPAADAYGEAKTEAIIHLPIDIFKVEGAIDFDMLKVGSMLPMSDDQGNQMNGKVLGFNDESVTMDFNHPLAGQTLHFSGEVLSVRQATPEEIAHGHVH